MRTMTEEFVERARKEEREETRKEERKGKAKMIKAGMKNFNVSFEQICDITEIPMEDRPELKKLIDSM